MAKNVLRYNLLLGKGMVGVDDEKDSVLWTDYLDLFMRSLFVSVSQARPAEQMDLLAQRLA